MKRIKIRELLGRKMAYWLDEALAEGLRDWAVMEAARQSMHSVEGNIKRGMMAMRHVIETRRIEPKAMWRKELGWIGFDWGEPGATPPEFDSHAEFRKWQRTGRSPFDNGGHGISHILSKRDWEGEYIEEFIGQKGQEIAYKIVRAIAYGQIEDNGYTAVIKWRGLGVYLRKRTKGGETYWLISGYYPPKHGYRYKPKSGR